MKIIIYALNFKPELVGTGKYTGELADFLHKKGHQLHVITTHKYYPEWETKMNRYSIEGNSSYKVIRCPLYVPKFPNGIRRIMHLISFTISSFPIIIIHLFWRPECIVSIAPTIFCAPNVYFLKLFSLIKVSSVLIIQDFELDAAFGLGILKGNLIKNMFSKIEYLLINSFNKIGSISIGMLKKLIDKGIKEEKVFLMPNWVDLNKIKKRSNNERNNNHFRKKLNIPPETIVIQFSGSMNRKQGFPFLTPILENFKFDDNVLWLFGGDGICKKELIKATKNIKNIKFLPFQKYENLNEWLAAADIHIIPQDEKVEDFVFPSKLLAILASGNPIVSNVNLNSELGKVVKDAGIRVNPNDTVGFIEALEKLINNEKLRLSLGNRGRKIAEEIYDKKKVLERFNEIIKCL